MPDDEVQNVLRFWFPQQLGSDYASQVCQLEWWFRGGADAAIAERFSVLLAQATQGELEPQSRLALILVLDQFSRSLHKGTAQAFAQDPKALALTLPGLANGHYTALDTPWEKTFFFLPLGHSEELAHVELAVKFAEELVDHAPSELRRMSEHSASQARGHREVIARFGRQPHRNAALGQLSTPEELDYLASGQLVHLRSLPQ